MPSVTIQPGATISVTGVNGFIGSHVVDQLLQRGYNVRGTVRNVEKSKWVADYFNEKYKNARLELVQVPDLTIEGCYDEFMHGTEGFIHVAAPVGGYDQTVDIETVIAPSVNGGLNALKACAKAPSVKSVAFTSSAVAATFPKPNVEFSINEKSYNDQALQDVDKYPAKKNWYLYCIMKTETEKRVWKWIEENKPGFAFNTILPNANFGTVLMPERQGFPSSIEWARITWTGEGLSGLASVVDPQWFISPQDTALLHISALIHSDVASERLFGYAERWNSNQLLGLYRKHYPGKNFPEDLPGIVEDRMSVPNQRAEEVLRWVKGSGWDGLEESVVKMSADWGRD